MHAEEESEIGDVGEDDLARVGDLASVDCELDSSKAVEGGWVDIATAKAVEVVVRDLVNAVGVRNGLGATRVTVGVDTWSEVRVCDGEVGISRDVGELERVVGDRCWRCWEGWWWCGSRECG